MTGSLDPPPVERRAAFALGSNLGDRQAALQGAVNALATVARLRLVAVSPVFETQPVGGPEQPEFLNAVAVADTPLSPRTLLETARAIEDAFGRRRSVRWGPRTLDVDLLAVGDLVVDEPDLQIPHPRCAERAFVVIPWARADPAARLPDGRAVAELAGRLPTDGVRERRDLALVPVAVRLPR